MPTPALSFSWRETLSFYGSGASAEAACMITHAGLRAGASSRRSRRRQDARLVEASHPTRDMTVHLCACVGACDEVGWCLGLGARRRGDAVHRGISLFSYGGRSYAYSSDVGLDVGLFELV